MRRLIICSDGTWNDPSSNTNVCRLKDRLAEDNQLYFYDTGVGTKSVRAEKQGWLKNAWDRVSGGAFGAGLSGNVQEAYRWIAENYQEGDSLWFFGFSRGAFTVRSTVGFIRKVGLLRPPFDDELLEEAYDLYRRADDTPDTEDAIAFRNRNNTRVIGELDIAFLGVWDTVGALGIPGRFFGAISRRRWGFHDHRLSSHVKRAYQALAIDELRAAYLAALWEGSVEESQEVAQRWFAGHHSDIGGTKGDRPLKWIAGKAEAAGLVFTQPVDEWPEREKLPRRPTTLNSGWWRLVCGQGLRPVGDPRFPAQEVDESLDTLRDAKPPYRPENYVRWLNGDPMLKATGRSWWYTLPGANRYYLDQYGTSDRNR